MDGEIVANPRLGSLLLGTKELILRESHKRFEAGAGLCSWSPSVRHDLIITKTNVCHST